MRKVVLTLKEQEKYDTIKKLVETNGNKKRVAKKLRISERQVNRLIAGYKEFGKDFFVHGNNDTSKREKCVHKYIKKTE